MVGGTAARRGCSDRFLGWQALALVIKAAVYVRILEHGCVVTGAKDVSFLTKVRGLSRIGSVLDLASSSM